MPCVNLPVCTAKLPARSSVRNQRSPLVSTICAPPFGSAQYIGVQPCSVRWACSMSRSSSLGFTLLLQFHGRLSKCFYLPVCIHAEIFSDCRLPGEDIGHTGIAIGPSRMYELQAARHTE